MINGRRIVWNKSYLDYMRLKQICFGIKGSGPIPSPIYVSPPINILLFPSETFCATPCLNELHARLADTIVRFSVRFNVSLPLDNLVKHSNRPLYSLR